MFEMAEAFGAFFKWIFTGFKYTFKEVLQNDSIKLGKMKIDNLVLGYTMVIILLIIALAILSFIGD